MAEVHAWTGNAVVVLHERQEEAGGWLASSQGTSPVVRDRMGRQAANTVFGPVTAPHAEQMARADRLLNSDQLWMVYKRTPDVRAAIDAITRRVATWNWLVEPVIPPSDPLYTKTLEDAAAVTSFFQMPNTDGETWQELWTKLVIDLMVFDAGVIENVFAGEVDGDGEVQATEDLEELVALKGSTIFPVVDTHGHVLGYRQNTTGMLGPIVVVEDFDSSSQFGSESGDLNPFFGKEQIVYMRLFPNTSSPLGVPLIETLINEIITMMRQSENTMLTFDADEIPPGILVLTGLAGKAAEAAKQDLQKLRGKDHKIRVVTNPDPKATGAHWVELRRTPKDVDFVNVIDRVRRTIWRVFGVLPIEMGASEDMPRSVGQVQLEVSGSHLINPILEMIEAKVNGRILPLVADDPDAARRLRFRFDRESKLSPSDQKEMASTLVALVREGMLTRNEARKIRGDHPVNGGDVVTITTGQGTFPLETIVNAPATGVPTASSGQPEQPTEPAPGPGTAQASQFSFRHFPHLATAYDRTLLGDEDLPSAWQPAGMFAKYRTLDLTGLFDEVTRYSRNIDPIYGKAAIEVGAAFRSMYEPGKLTEDRANELTRRVSATLDKLEREWGMAVEETYIRTARLGRTAARDFTGLPVLEDVDERASQYGNRAMQFLAEPNGMLSDLRARLLATIQALTVRSDRAAQHAPANLDAFVSVEEAVGAADGAFVAQHHRVKNWSGRLVELGNTMLVAGMLEASTVLEAGRPTPAEWMVEWVHAGDKNMCATCTIEGSAGFRPLSSLSTRPGGDTECRGKCRCVLVLWTRSEVDRGVAVPLSGDAA